MLSPYTGEYDPWAPLLAQALGIPIDHVGMSGWTTKQMLTHLDDATNVDVCKMKHSGLRRLIRKGRYTHVLIMAGTNDLGHDATEEQIVGNLASLHAACHALGVATVAVSIPDCKASTLNREIGRRRRLVNEQLRIHTNSLPDDQMVYLEPNLTWQMDSPDFEADGLHLSKSGYSRWATLLLESGLRDALRTIKSHNVGVRSTPIVSVDAADSSKSTTFEGMGASSMASTGT